MSLTVFPTIVFDASGSDTVSGAGPSTAISGSLANIAASSTTTITINDAVNLSGVATDGSAVLWINTASGRQFSRISVISGSSGNWTLTVEDSTWTISTNKTWGIGGKRLSIDNTNSRKLFTADVKAGWTIQLNANQSLAGGAISILNVGDTTNGPVTVIGNSDNPRPIITQTTNVAIFQTAASNGRWNFKNLAFQNSSGTNNIAWGILIQNGSWTVNVSDCVFGDATHPLQTGVRLASGAIVSIVDCEIKNCGGDGVTLSSGSSNITIDGCNIHNNGGCGVNVTTTAASLTIQNSTIYGNGSDGAGLTGTITVVQITDNVIDSNSSNGVNLGANIHSQLVIYNNNITNNTLYGITTTSSAMDACKSYIDYNCYGHGSDTDGPANGSGPYFGITSGAHDQIGISPNYIGRTASPPNFTNATTSNVKAKGFPDSTRTIGGNTGGTTAHDDIGVQHQDAGSIPNQLIKTGNIGTY